MLSHVLEIYTMREYECMTVCLYETLYCIMVGKLLLLLTLYCIMGLWLSNCCLFLLR
jgi:hypothetical protein